MFGAAQVKINLLMCIEKPTKDGKISKKLQITDETFLCSVEKAYSSFTLSK